MLLFRDSLELHQVSVQAVCGAAGLVLALVHPARVSGFDFCHLRPLLDLVSWLRVRVD